MKFLVVVSPPSIYQCCLRPYIPWTAKTFDKLSTSVDWLDINDTGLEVQRKTGASYNAGVPSPPLILKCPPNSAAALHALLPGQLLLS